MRFEGSVKTPISQVEHPEDVKRGLQVTAQERCGRPIEIANLVVFLLSGEGAFVTGAVHNSDGGWICYVKTYCRIGASVYGRVAEARRSPLYDIKTAGARKLCRIPEHA